MDLTRKARFVAGDHLTDPPTAMTYASVVSRDSVRIAFLLAALNDLEHSICVIVQALYGLKTSANAWCNHMCSTLHDMGFEHSLINAD